VVGVSAVAAATGGNTKMITNDANNHQIIIEQVVAATGVRVASSAAIEIKVPDLAGTNKVAKFQVVFFKDYKDSCSMKKAWVLMTDPEPDV
jgi:hypothetical protein